MADDPHVADARAALTLIVESNEPFRMVQLGDGLDDLGDELAGERGHQALVTAEQLGWIVGDELERGGGSALWTGVRPTPDGLRAVGAWPPAGREGRPGPWDRQQWGMWARPTLELVAADELDHVSLGMGSPIDDQRRFLALWLLVAAGLVDARRVDTAAITGVRITPAGRAALAGEQTHLDRARILLAQEGNATQALIDLVEGEVDVILTAAAERTQTEMTDRNGEPLTKLRQRIDRLATAEALSKYDAAILRAALEYRHVVGHTPSADVDHDHDEVAWIIDGVERVRDRVIGAPNR